MDTLLLDPEIGPFPVEGGLLDVKLVSSRPTKLILRQYPSGSMLVESDAPTPDHPVSRIDMHIPPGPLELQVIGPVGQVYKATVTFTPSTTPGQPVAGAEIGPYAPVVASDFNRDGIPDLATPGGVNLGMGDGTFQPVPGTSLAGSGGEPSSMVVSDFNGDGFEDIAVADASTRQISVFAGRGDGTFTAPVSTEVASTPVALAVAPIKGSGLPELAVVENDPGEIVILRNRGDLAFQPVESLVLSDRGILGQPRSITTGVLGNDPRGPVDLAVAYGEGPDGQAGGVLVFPGRDDGTFGAPGNFQAGLNPVSVVAADFNGDGHTDLAVSDQGDINKFGDFSNFGHVSAVEKIVQIAADAASLPAGHLGGLVVLLNRADGTFAAMPEVSAGFLPQSLLVGDFNGDHKADVVVLHGLTVASSLFLGGGNGLFQTPTQVVPSYPASAVGLGQYFGQEAVAADFNGDGREDLAQTTTFTTALPILLGKGDGGFQGQSANATGDIPISMAVGDLNGDGIPDLAVVDAFSADITILLGQGDGTFVHSQRLPTPFFPASVVVTDLNRDGRSDLVVADAGASTVSVFLGNGNGTFVDAGQTPVGSAPTSVMSEDLNGDGIPDIAAADTRSNSISILLGRGDGTFSPVVNYPVGQEPVSIAAADFEGQGHPDLVVADLASNNLAILRNQGNGTFAPAVFVSVGQEPDSIAVHDLNGDGIPDLAVSNSASGSVSILLGKRATPPGGGMAPLVSLPAIPLGVTSHSDPISLTVADLNGDGIPDIAVADASLIPSGYIDVLYGTGDGTFPREAHFAEDSLPVSIAAGRFVAGGPIDLVVSRLIGNDVDIRLNQDGNFGTSVATSPTGESAPLVLHLPESGTDVVLSLDATGHILWRPMFGRGTASIGYGSPTLLDPKLLFRSMALVKAGTSPLVASLALSGKEIDFFAYRNGTFVLVNTIALRDVGTQIFAIDATPGGNSSLLVSNRGNGSVTLLGGSSEAPLKIAGDVGLTDIATIPGPGASPTIVASVESTGEIEVLNAGNPFLSNIPRYAAGTGPLGYQALSQDGASHVSSLEGVTGLATGNFVPGESMGLVAITPGSNHITLMHGLSGGRFGNPIAFKTAMAPLAVRVADFNGDGLPDVAILESGAIQLFLNDGNGGLVDHGLTSLPTGFRPIGLSVADLSGRGRNDLIVSNAFGDVLVFINDGSGSFQTPDSPVRQMGLELDPTSHTFAITDPSTDRVTVQRPGSPVTTTVADITSSLRDPGPPVFADLNGDGIPDLIYANGGGDEVRVYLGLKGGGYRAPLSFAVGTDPVGVTVASLGGDNAPADLIVANQGSNDVSILIGSGKGQNWTLIEGPRLRVGAGPAATSVVDLHHDGVYDLVVSESLANDVRILRGIGSGFFDDRSPQIIPTGKVPGPPVTVQLGQGATSRTLIAVPNAGSDTITMIDGTTFVTATISSEGITPVALIEQNATTLLVANEGDGHLGMLRFDASGEFFSSGYLTDPQLPHLSALAFDELDGLTPYATTQGKDSAVLFDENGGLAKGDPVELFPPGHSGPTENLFSPIAELSNNLDSPNVRESSREFDSAASFTVDLLSLTPLPESLVLSDASTETTTDTSTIAAVSVPTGLGQPILPSKPLGPDHDSEGESSEDDQPQGSSASKSPLPGRFVRDRGVEEALDETRNHILGELSADANPAREEGEVKRDDLSIFEVEARSWEISEQREGPPIVRENRAAETLLLIDEAVGLLVQGLPIVPPRNSQSASSTPDKAISEARSEHHDHVAPLPQDILIPLTALLVAAPTLRRPTRFRSALRRGVRTISIFRAR